MIERGAWIAEALRGAWRASPPPVALASAQWATITPLLLLSGGAGLAWWKQRASPLASSPFAAEQRDAYRMQVLLGGQQARELASVLASLPHEPLYARGLACARHYGVPGLRTVGDIDLYVRGSEYEAVRAALLRRPEAANVDLHRGFSQLEERGADELYRRSRVVEIGSARVRVFGDEDHLRLLCLHLLGHGAWRPSWLCDVAALVEANRALDWDLVLAGDRRRADWIICAVALAGELLGAEIAGTPGATRALPRWLVDAVLAQWGSPVHIRSPIASLWRRPAMLARELWHRWPNSIEATVGVGGAFDERPRLPHQLGECARRITRFTAVQLRARGANGSLSSRRRDTE